MTVIFTAEQIKEIERIKASRPTTININIENLVVKQEVDIEEVARKMYEKLKTKGVSS